MDSPSVIVVLVFPPFSCHAFCFGGAGFPLLLHFGCGRLFGLSALVGFGFKGSDGWFYLRFPCMYGAYCSYLLREFCLLLATTPFNKFAVSKKKKNTVTKVV